MTESPETIQRMALATETKRCVCGRLYQIPIAPDQDHIAALEARVAKLQKQLAECGRERKKLEDERNKWRSITGWAAHPKGGRE